MEIANHKPSTSRLRNITFRSHTEAWALGGGGAYVTDDQGLTWKAVPVDTGDEISDDMSAMGEFNPFLLEESELESEASEASEEEVSEGPTLTYDETPEAIQNRLRAQRQRPDVSRLKVNCPLTQNERHQNAKPSNSRHRHLNLKEDSEDDAVDSESPVFTFLMRNRQWAGR